MKNVALFLSILLVVFMSLVVRECAAVIYQYVDEKGEPALVDDLQKVPEQYRSSTKMVSGEVTTERSEDARARDAARVAALRQERSALQASAETSRRQRYLWSGAIAAAVMVMLVIMANLDVMKEHHKVANRLRTALIALFVLYLGIAHGRDVIGLFGRASDSIQHVQDEQAEKGRQAAEFFKTVDQVLDQQGREQPRTGQESKADEQ